MTPLLILFMIIIAMILVYYCIHLKSVEHFNESIIKSLNSIKLEQFGTTTPISIGGQQYNVQKSFDNKEEAGAFLSKLNIQNQKFITKLRAEYPNNEAVKLLVKRYRVNNISEVDPNNKSGSTSYIVNKGKEIGFCVRQKENPEKFNNFNTTMYVVLHEMAHLASKTYGHGTEFRNNFKFLLNEAHRQGVYESVNYMARPSSYCGIMISEIPPNF